jgi:hypothetical protein
MRFWRIFLMRRLPLSTSFMRYLTQRCKYGQWGQYHRASTLKRWLLAYARLYGGIAPTGMDSVSLVSAISLKRTENT